MLLFNTADFIRNKSYWYLKIVSLNNDTNIDNDSILMNYDVVANKNKK